MALLAILIVFGLSGARLHAESAKALFKRAQNAEAREDYDTAFDNYQKAYKKNPKDLRCRAALYRIRVTDSALHMTKGRKLMEAGREPEALAEFLRAAEIDSSNEAAQQEIAKLRQKNGEVAPASEASLPEASGVQQQIDSMGAPAELKPVSSEPVTLHMQEDAKVVYQAIGKAAGINVLFDPDFQSKRIQVDLNSVSLVDALRIVGTISNTFWRPVTNNTIFVAQNTRTKRTELDEEAVQTFYLSNAWQQNDLTDVQTAIRNVLPNAKAYAVAGQNAIVIRGTPDELLLAQKLINDLDKPRAEVVVDIAVLEGSKNWEKNLGIAWPSDVSVALQTATTTTTSGTSGTTTTTTPTLYNLAHLKASNFAVTVGSAQLNILLNDSNTKILDNPRIRCTDQQKATMKIGERIPIATGSYQTGASTSTISSLVNTQFQYQDVGINIELTPTIHFDRDVTLKIKIEDSSLNGTSTISGVTEPIIAQKTSEQVIRLREGEASVLSGMVNKTDQVAWTGVPGLSAIPGLKYLFGSKDHTIQEDEIVFVIVPHVVRSQDLEPVNLRTIDTGAGQSIELRHVPSEEPGSNFGPGSGSNSGSNPPPVSLARPLARPRPAVGVISSQSATEAAPAAMTELLQAADANGKNAASAQLAAAPPASAPGSAPFAPQAASPAKAPAALLAAAPQPARVSFAFAPQSGPVAAGADFKLPVVLNGGVDIAMVPLQIEYDAAKLSLLNVDKGDFLGRDGQPVSLVHRDDGPGSIKISASRPPGAAGVSGTGVVCVLTFQARAAGVSVITITRPGAVTSTRAQLPAQGAQVNIQVK